MSVTLRQLADLVRGTIEGDGDTLVHSARILQEAQPGDITFLDKKNEVQRLEESKATAAVVALDVPLVNKALIRVADPLTAFVAIVRRLQGKRTPRPIGIHSRALVDDSVRIGDDPSIHAGAIVGAGTILGKRCILHPGVVVGQNCRLGDDVILYPNVVLYEDSVLGNRVIIHANSTIGADGFGYRFQQGKHVKVPQLGHVVIGDDVEIGANSAVDRGTFGATTIGEGTKIDNMVQIAHNCQIGKHNAIAGQVGIGGSSVTGNYVYMGGQAGIADHITLGDGVMLGAKTGVLADVPAGARMFLYPALEERIAARVMGCLKRLPAMREDLRRVLRTLELKETTDHGAAKAAP